MNWKPIIKWSLILVSLFVFMSYVLPALLYNKAIFEAEEDLARATEAAAEAHQVMVSRIQASDEAAAQYRALASQVQEENATSRRTITQLSRERAALAQQREQLAAELSSSKEEIIRFTDPELENSVEAGLRALFMERPEPVFTGFQADRDTAISISMAIAEAQTQRLVVSNVVRDLDAAKIQANEREATIRRLEGQVTEAEDTIKSKDVALASAADAVVRQEKATEAAEHLADTLRKRIGFDFWHPRITVTAIGGGYDPFSGRAFPCAPCAGIGWSW